MKIRNVLTEEDKLFLRESSKKLTIPEMAKILNKNTATIRYFVIKNELEYKRIWILEATQLTKRESEVMALVAKGLSNDDITQKLCISRATLSSHLNHIYKKYELADIAETSLQRLKAVLKYQKEVTNESR